MRISVIIPAYNAEKWVAGCLESMLLQSYRPLEVLLIDDGSTDRTAEIAQGYVTGGGSAHAEGAACSGSTTVEGISIRLLRQANAGLSVSRNRGLVEATGEYVHFLDVDDQINDRFYELLAAAALAADADAACCEVINQPNPHRNTPIAENHVLVSTCEKMRGTNVGRWSYAWRYLFRRSFLLEHKLQFEPGRLIEDMAFSLAAIYFANRVAMAAGAVYTYMLHPGSIMTRRDRAWIRRRRRDLRHAKELRHRFARQHHFTIPGVPTRLGFLSLLFVKWLT